MPSGKPEVTCGDHGGTNTRGEPCGRSEGWGRDSDSGKCRQHAGKSPDGSSHEGNNNAEGNDGGAPEDNGNAETHGLTSDGEKWFKRHREDAKGDVKLMVESWMEDAPFGWDRYGKVRMLVDAAINECQIRRGDEYIAENDVVVEHYDGHDKVSGREIREYKANPAFGYKTSLQNSTIRILKELDILESPDSRQADAMGDLKDLWAEELRG